MRSVYLTHSWFWLKRHECQTQQVRSLNLVPPGLRCLRHCSHRFLEPPKSEPSNKWWEASRECLGSQGNDPAEPELRSAVCPKS